MRLPLVGEIAAGGPLLAEENIEEYVPMPASTKGDFLLRVKGESMIEAGILDGDLVIVQRAQDARNGEIVVALAGDDESADEATVKTFYREQRPRPPAAGERGAGADLRRARPDPRARRGGLPGALMTLDRARRLAAPDARPGAGRAAARRLARVPRLRRVRDARARQASSSAPSAAASSADEDALGRIRGLECSVQAG